MILYFYINLLRQKKDLSKAIHMFPKSPSMIGLFGWLFFFLLVCWSTTQAFEKLSGTCTGLLGLDIIYFAILL